MKNTNQIQPNWLKLDDVDYTIAKINEFNNALSLIENSKLFLTIEDVMDLTGFGKTKTQDLFNWKDFPACDIGKQKIVLFPAFVDFFMERRSREEMEKSIHGKAA